MRIRGSIIRSQRAWLIFGVAILTATNPLHAQTLPQQDSTGEGEAVLSPLAAKEEMIRDRLSRFQDRIFHLRQKLLQTEPENAARLARALERSGELGLADQLAVIIEMLKSPSEIAGAIDQQNEWIEKADRLLDILLERDSSDRHRDEKIDRLHAQRKQLSKLLEQQRALRDASARTSVLQRLQKQYDQFLRRIEALSQRQAETGEAAETQSNLGADKKRALAERQVEASRMAEELSEDLKQASESRPDARADSSEAKAARQAAGEAAKATQQAAKAMHESAQELKENDPNAAQAANEKAKEALNQAREEIERALQELGRQSSSRSQAGAQGEVAEQTRGLADEMRKGGEEGGQNSQQSRQSQNKGPDPENLDRAGGDMDDARESLEQDQPEQATEQQEDAIEKLEQTQQELEDELNQLRKEDRGEMLRDLEARFRIMLAKQRSINGDTDSLTELGSENFARADRLQVAELAERQRSLAERASSCVHILDEEGTTIVFPRVVGQLSTDMDIVATRLGDTLVDALTQAMQQELIETLEQLLESVKQMQQENEQPGDDGMSAESESPLLPTSAELKLLRSSQRRVNTRTEAIESIRQASSVSREVLMRDLKDAAQRQTECKEIAEELRERKNQP